MLPKFLVALTTGFSSKKKGSSMPTILVSGSAQQVQPGVHTYNFTIASGASELDISLTRQSWPAGQVINSAIVYNPQGQQVGGVPDGIQGGDVMDRNQNPMTTQDFSIAAAQGQTLPPGVYSLALDVAQTITTAITVTSQP